MRFRLLCQVLGTVATLGWVPGNAAKLVTMVIIWAFGFGRIRAAELAAMGLVNLIFVLMNQAALKQGVFGFDHPDLLGMPAYELLTWGFYTLHAIRFVNGRPPRGRWIFVVIATGHSPCRLPRFQTLLFYFLRPLPCWPSCSSATVPVVWTASGEE
jgi:hypothetical protein